MWHQKYNPQKLKEAKVGSHQTNKQKKKERNNKMTKLPMEYDRIFANHISDRGLIFKLYKKLI